MFCRFLLRRAHEPVQLAADGEFDPVIELPGRGRKPVYDSERVKQLVDTTLRTTPKGETHWSTRSLAHQEGVSHSTIRRIWNAHRLKPHLVRTFKLSNDKRFKPRSSRLTWIAPGVARVERILKP